MQTRFLLVCLLLLTCARFGTAPAAQVTTPTVYHQAPMLDAAVAAGTLPPVAQRLPDHPAIVKPLHKIGQYGGTWRALAASASDLQLNNRLGYEPLVRWSRTGTGIEPGVAESWEMRDEGKTFIFHLRKGMKWSDGHPFTSADFVFTAEEVLRNPNLSWLSLTSLKSNNELPTVEAPDEYTVIFRFTTPYGSFPYGLAYQGQQHELFCPRHYVMQFHPKYVPEAELKEKIKKSGFREWSELFMFTIDHDRNPDLPTVAPFKVKVPWPSPRCVAERNPYYWKVDPEGNQLPYIDQIAFTTAFDSTVLNMKAMNGEVDFQMRRIEAGYFTLFKERGPELGYRVLVTPSTSPTCVYVNLHSVNEKLRPLLQDRRFRLALSHAINREELVELIYSGMAEPSSGFTIPQDTYHIPGLERANTEYDPDRSNRLLDEIGMKRGRSGLRHFPDGTPFAEILYVYPSEEGMNPDLWQLVVDYWREAGLQFSMKHQDVTQAYLQATAGNTDFWTYVNASLHWAVEGIWKVPIASMSYMAPAYGSYYASSGRLGAPPPPEIQRLVDWYFEMRSTPDEARRLELGHKIMRQWAEECYVIGICRSPVVGILSNRFRNVPETDVNYDYRLKSPGYLSIEQFYIDEQEGKR